MERRCELGLGLGLGFGLGLGSQPSWWRRIRVRVRIRARVRVRVRVKVRVRVRVRLRVTTTVAEEAMERRCEALVAAAVEEDTTDGRPTIEGGRTADPNPSPPWEGGVEAAGPAGASGGCGDGRHEG